MNNIKTAYLTIDDAPTIDMVWKAEYLLSKRIPAIWYCCGEALEKHFDLALEVLNLGFIVGNHSYTHRHFSELSMEDARKEIVTTDKIIDNLYKEAGKNPIKTFRFPFGDKGNGEDAFGQKDSSKNPFVNEIQKILKNMGYRQPQFKGITYKKYHEKKMLDDADVYWTYDCREWTMSHQGTILEELTARMDKVDPDNWLGLNTPSSSEIILIHDHVETSHIFKALIEKLLSKNLVFELPEF